MYIAGNRDFMVDSDEERDLGLNPTYNRKYTGVGYSKSNRWYGYGAVGVTETAYAARWAYAYIDNEKLGPREKEFMAKEYKFNTGFHKYWDLVVWVYGSDSVETFIFRWKGVGGRNEIDHTFITAFRGTDWDWADIIAMAMGSPLAMNFLGFTTIKLPAIGIVSHVSNRADGEVHLHPGMFMYVCYALFNFSKGVEGWVNGLVSWCRWAPPTYVTGHSLGGAAACVFAHLYWWPMGINGCHTFGSFKMKDYREYLQRCSIPGTTYCHENDPVGGDLTPSFAIKVIKWIIEAIVAAFLAYVMPYVVKWVGSALNGVGAMFQKFMPTISDWFVTRSQALQGWVQNQFEGSFLQSALQWQGPDWFSSALNGVGSKLASWIPEKFLGFAIPDFMTSFLKNKIAQWTWSGMTVADGIALMTGANQWMLWGNPPGTHHLNSHCDVNHYTTNQDLWNTNWMYGNAWSGIGNAVTMFALKTGLDWCEAWIMENVQAWAPYQHDVVNRKLLRDEWKCKWGKCKTKHYLAAKHCGEETGGIFTVKDFLTVHKIDWYCQDIGTVVQGGGKVGGPDCTIRGQWARASSISEADTIDSNMNWDARYRYAKSTMYYSTHIQGSYFTHLITQAAIKAFDDTVVGNILEIKYVGNAKARKRCEGPTWCAQYGHAGGPTHPCYQGETPAWTGDKTDRNVRCRNSYCESSQYETGFSGGGGTSRSYQPGGMIMQMRL